MLNPRLMMLYRAEMLNVLGGGAPSLMRNISYWGDGNG